MTDDGAEIFGRMIPFAGLCGVEPVSMGAGRSELRLTVEERHTNSLGMAHGGLVMTLLDIALATAARSTLAEDTTVLTIDIHTTFLAPARGALRAQGRVVKSGRTLLFAEAEVLDANDVVCARASGVFRPIPARVDGGRGGDA
ncbi:MAG: PaaI family thioesterase [Methylobacteriaceae bacterium]|nr:PaaI family thioesterase [Methylobacteriaceae bacterium]